MKAPGRVLVTGASGGLGRRVVPLLRADGWDVRAMIHSRPVEDADDTVVADLTDPAAVRSAVRGCEAVLHLAARTHARRARSYDRVNVEGTRHLLDACAAEGVHRLVHVSTRAIDADAGWYASSKARAENAVLAAPVDAVVVRLAEVLGAGPSEGVDDMIARASRGAAIPIVGDGDDQLAPVHVNDVLPALARALREPGIAGRIYTLEGTPVTYLDFVRRCQAHFGTNGRRIHLPVAAVAALAAVGRVLPLPIYPDQLRRLRAPKPSTRADPREDLGFRPRALDEALPR